MQVQRGEYTKRLINSLQMNSGKYKLNYAGKKLVRGCTGGKQPNVQSAILMLYALLETLWSAVPPSSDVWLGHFTGNGT